MIGGKGRLCCTGVLPDRRGIVRLRRRIDGPEHQCIHQRQQDAHAKHRAGRAEPLEQRVPLHRHLGRILGTAAGGAGIGAVCPAHPAIHEQCHLRPDGERRNGKDEQKFNKSDPHRAFSFIFRAFSGGISPYRFSIASVARQFKHPTLSPGFCRRLPPFSPSFLPKPFLPC